MSRTLTVKELINELLEFDMDDDVFIEAGEERVKIDELRSGSNFGRTYIRIVPEFTLCEEKE